MTLADFCKGIIRYSFYSLFFFVPIVFTTDNSELFELTKMWLTWGLTAVIVAAWISKMIAERKVKIQKTPLDIPLMLFLSSQVISTLLSLDMRISIWGYYSRFNGGLLSTISYILLYYALVSNLTIKNVRRLLYTSLISAALVVLWGLPAHFGLDPTCYVVRGSFDISCWTDQFVPTVRIFSTLGQPAWMAAYISFLLPVILAFLLKSMFPATKNEKKQFVAHEQSFIASLTSRFSILYIVVATLFYVALIFANTRAGFLAFVVGNAFFWAVLLLLSLRRYLPPFLICSLIFAVCNFLFGVPIPQLQPYSIGTKVQHGVMQAIGSEKTPAKKAAADTSPPSSQTQQSEQIETGVANITDSGNIRVNVWQGAISAWKANPVFGTGVETFAFAYYKHKPVGQNLTSEWDYLYNKAHNEYLNYLATTGLYGLLTYLLFIGWFWYLMLRWFLKEGIPLLKGEPIETSLKPEYAYLTLGILAGFITIYISNFFGFSVVIVNLYLFLGPGFVFILLKTLAPSDSTAKINESNTSALSSIGYGAVSVVWLLCLYILYLLVRFWIADKAYALGYNLDRVGQYQDAYPSLAKAVKQWNEPVFQDEFAYDSAVLAGAYAEQKNAQNAQQLATQALGISDKLLLDHPNNIVFLKNRVRMLYELSKINPQYMLTALQTIQKAYEMAPNDAKIGYNYGVLLGQTGNVTQGIQVLEKMKQIKPDFRDVYFALGLFYRDRGTNGGKTIVNQDQEKKAEENMHYILTNLNPTDKAVKDQLSSWGIK